MKAIQITTPGRAELVEIPDLIFPASGTSAANQVLLKVDLVGMCGSDLSTFRGANPLVTYPRILGHEVAATVVDGGAHFAAGTRVTLSPYTHCGMCPSCRRGLFNACQFNQTMGVQRDGAMTEFITLPPERIYASTLSSPELCLVEPLTVGAHAVARGRVTATDTVAVFGCGGIGLGVIAASAFRGATTIAIDVDDAKLEIARKAGATHLINTSSQQLHTALAEITSGAGPDVAIEAIGLPETFLAAVEMVAFTGRVVYVGYSKQPVTYETRLFVQKELDVMGSRNALPEDFHQVIRMIESGVFPVADAISIMAPPEDAPEILASWSQTPARFTKIMIQFGG